MVNIPNTHALLDIRRTDSLAQVDDELGNLLDVDDIFALFSVFAFLNDLGATRHLQWLFF